MKRKLLAGFVLTSILSANSFAMEITHGKFISHKEWTKGKLLNASFKETDKLNIPALQLPKRKIAADVPMNVDWVSSYSQVFGNVQGVVGQDVQLGGYSRVDIYNNSPVSKTYTITTSIADYTCTSDNMLCKVNGSATSQDTVVLDAGGSINITRSPFMTENFSEPEKSQYWIYSDVQVDGGTIFANDSNAGNITITDGSLKK